MFNMNTSNLAKVMSQFKALIGLSVCNFFFLISYLAYNGLSAKDAIEFSSAIKEMKQLVTLDLCKISLKQYCSS